MLKNKVRSDNITTIYHQPGFFERQNEFNSVVSNLLILDPDLFWKDGSYSIYAQSIFPFLLIILYAFCYSRY